MRTAGRISVESAATWLPPDREAVAQVCAEGRLSPDDVAASGYHWLPVAGDLAAPDMAVLAARRALAAVGRPAASIDLVVHAWIYHQGHDFWSPAHYVAHQVGARSAVPIGVQQMCNGGGAGLELVAARLLADPTMMAGLVTTADRFGDPGFDRWRSDYGVLYGDGAGAAVLTRASDRPGSLDLLAIATVAAPELESMHRGERPFSVAARGHGSTVDVRETKKAFLATWGRDAFSATVAQAVDTVVSTALAEAGLAPADPRLRVVLLPRLGRGARESIYAPVIAGATTAPCLDLGDGTGHLGAGDVLANLAALTGDELIDPGEFALLLSAGAGFSWTCVVVGRPATTAGSGTDTPERTLHDNGP
jgi:3-oxoacyl-[acyl-carrier-protein] synthase III